MDILNIDLLSDGIKKFTENFSKQWDPDFHNKLYQELELITGTTISQDTWAILFKNLKEWGALRGVKEKTIFENGISLLNELNHELEKLDNLDKDKLTWTNIKPLLEVAAKIKTSKSPVFASKLCHFLRPNIFIVADCRFVKIGPDLDSYKNYWMKYDDAWSSHRDKKAFIEQFKIETNIDSFNNYPFKTKICELCRIGLKG